MGAYVTTLQQRVDQKDHNLYDSRFVHSFNRERVFLPVWNLNRVEKLTMAHASRKLEKQNGSLYKHNERIWA